ncbi:hypothetical protein SAMN04515671_2017 [Nakamurella panacisegetis]|uniref:Uncharacterized protein n=1 Tax=Nakamurella panacisegetis TaxID=1090615 RepID=A0A1H0MHI2_9ACTN|nr:hypothetical protein [Nakamurella panacisegetis]SDO79913.1 hypothetical protein SAMN04515671_2017 [Nakamurella panacisegetis]
MHDESDEGRISVRSDACGPDLLTRRPWWAAVVAGMSSMLAAGLLATLLRLHAGPPLAVLLVGSGVVGVACAPRAFWGKSALSRHHPMDAQGGRA